MVQKLAVLTLLLAPLACGGDGDGSTGPAQIPDVKGSFVGSLSMTALDNAITLRCNVRLAIDSQTGSEWDGIIHFTQSNELCTAGETDAVSGTINANRQATMTLDDSDLAEGCTTFSGSKVFTGSLIGSVLTVSNSITCDDVSMDIELTVTRS
jgi:hypothetical protein